MVDVDVAWVWLTIFLCIRQRVMQSQLIFATVLGHQQLSIVVTWSQAVFFFETPVAALSKVHIGVTTPCL